MDKKIETQVDSESQKRNWLELHQQLNVLKEEVDRDRDNWLKYQGRIHRIFDEMARTCLEMESYILNKSELDLVKQFFYQIFRDHLRCGKLNKWVMDRPYGYVGDFHIIDEIYRNSIDSGGYERCVDNYFLDSAASIATRSRKDDFKHYIKTCIEHSTDKTICIMDLGCGPCRLEKELMGELVGQNNKAIIFDCIDHDQNSLDYAKQLFDGTQNPAEINFVQKNALKIALCKSVDRMLPHQYHLVFSVGLFDYFDDNIIERLIHNLREALVPRGRLMISNYREASQNPSRIYMDWGIDWKLHYRAEADFIKLFINAGFSPDDLSIQNGYKGIMQYCIASKK